MDNLLIAALEPGLDSADRQFRQQRKVRTALPDGGTLKSCMLYHVMRVTSFRSLAAALSCM